MPPTRSLNPAQRPPPLQSQRSDRNRDGRRLGDPEYSATTPLHHQPTQTHSQSEAQSSFPDREISPPRRNLGRSATAMDQLRASFGSAASGENTGLLELCSVPTAKRPRAPVAKMGTSAAGAAVPPAKRLKVAGMVPVGTGASAVSQRLGPSKPVGNERLQPKLPPLTDPALAAPAGVPARSTPASLLFPLSPPFPATAPFRPPYEHVKLSQVQRDNHYNTFVEKEFSQHLLREYPKTSPNTARKIDILKHDRKRPQYNEHGQLIAVKDRKKKVLVSSEREEIRNAYGEAYLADLDSKAKKNWKLPAQPVSNFKLPAPTPVSATAPMPPPAKSRNQKAHYERCMQTAWKLRVRSQYPGIPTHIALQMDRVINGECPVYDAEGKLIASAKRHIPRAFSALEELSIKGSAGEAALVELQHILKEKHKIVSAPEVVPVSGAPQTRPSVPVGVPTNPVPLPRPAILPSRQLVRSEGEKRRIKAAIAALLEEACFQTEPINPSYSFVPKGNTYLTRLSRKLTKDAGRVVYVVCASLKKKLGIQVPTEFHAMALEHDSLTKADRQHDADLRNGRTAREARLCLDGMFTAMPKQDADGIIERAFEVGSRRVGRTSILSLPERLRRATIAHIRHTHTDYDKLMDARGGPRGRSGGRSDVQPEIQKVWTSWGPPRPRISQHMSEDKSHFIDIGKSKLVRNPRQPDGDSESDEEEEELERSHSDGHEEDDEEDEDEDDDGEEEEEEEEEEDDYQPVTAEEIEPTPHHPADSEDDDRPLARPVLHNRRSPPRGNIRRSLSRTTTPKPAMPQLTIPASLPRLKAIGRPSWWSSSPEAEPEVNPKVKPEPTPNPKSEPKAEPAVSDSPLLPAHRTTPPLRMKPEPTTPPQIVLISSSPVTIARVPHRKRKRQPEDVPVAKREREGMSVTDDPRIKPELETVGGGRTGSGAKKMEIIEISD